MNNKKTEERGLMMPLLAYRFRILLGGMIDPENVFTKNIENVVMDYKNKTMRIVARQPEIDANMTNVINCLCQSENFFLRVENLAGSPNIVLAVNEYCECTIKSHRFELAYGISDTAKHELEISFKNIKTLKGE